MSNQPFDDQAVEVERYELREPNSYLFEADRREFIQALGAGLMIVAMANTATAQRRRGRNARRAETLSERFHLGEDGTVTVLTSKVEVGQGARTQITQAVAEEFRLPVDRIRLIMADTGQCPDDGGTSGSQTTPSTVPRVRNAAAAARELLGRHAAEQLGVSRSQLVIKDGVFSADAGKQLTFAQLAADKELRAQLNASPPADGVEITPTNEWRVLGTAVKKVDGRDVVTGAAKYPSDISRPGMLYGKVLRPASYGATLKSIDLAPAQAMHDVTVVRDGEFVGCAAPTSWQAAKAVNAVAQKAEWERPPHPSSEQLFTRLKETGRKDGGGRRGSREWGDVEKALADASKKFSAEYTVAYIQHAPMEPRAAVAEWTDGRLTVWTGTQQPARVYRELCESFRLADDQVRVIVPDTGGGFGGKHTGEAAVEAARLAKAAGKPVHLQWTREEEFTWAYFRPAGLIEVQAGIDPSGKLVGWDFTNYNSGGSAIATPYTVPNGRTRFVESDSPLRQGSYRALASTANTFARESAMDELVELAATDPLEFRLQHLEDGRLKDVLRAAAEKFDWPRRRADRVPNRGVGLACGTEKGSYVAACADVEVVDGTIRVLHVCQAYECGAIQNPGNLRAQVDGSLIMGLGGALSEEMVFENGRISNPSFSDYHVPRMNDVPELDIVLHDRRDLPSVGAGETPIIAVAPAIANAIHHAIGKRCRSMPLRIA
ncbi:MAG: molybdopterin cofactor-binding domain-containing protein [Planctomycetaceae bacterium]